jgi:hypothetical protein
MNAKAVQGKTIANLDIPAVLGYRVKTTQWLTSPNLEKY